MSFEFNRYPLKLHILPDGRMSAVNAAAYLGLAPKTLAMWRCDGIGPRFTKIGGKVFYFQTDLDVWIDDAGKFSSTKQAELYQNNQEGI